MAMLHPRLGIPIDVAEDVLVRTQPKDLIRCKAVCKDWLDLISSPRFINKQLLHQSSRLKIITETNIPREVVSLSVDGHDEPAQVYMPPLWKKSARVYMPPLWKKSAAIVGSCNGILCLISGRERERIHLWNPSTREHLRGPFIPDQDGSVFALGFGYDATSGDYKVVILSNKTHNPSYNYWRTEYIVQVWSTKSTHGFRKIKATALSEILMVVPPEYNVFQYPTQAAYSIFHRSGIFLRGKLYWLLHSYCFGYAAVLISIDLGDETVHSNEILPNAIANQIRNSVVPFDFMGALAMPIWPDVDVNLFHIWVLDDDDKSWIHKLTIGPFQSGWACPVGVCIDGKFLMRVEKKFFLYDLRTEEEKKVLGAESPGWGYPCWSFVESLVSLRFSMDPLPPPKAQGGIRLVSDKHVENVMVSLQVASSDNDQTTEEGMTKRAIMDSEAYPSSSKCAKEEHLPSFTKTMMRSHVSEQFVLPIPEPFCRSHMPTTKTAYITLEGENEAKFKVKFISGTPKRFSGGWRVFSVSHNLVEGDILEFNLIKDCYFKVRVNRVNASANTSSCNVSASEDLNGKKRKLDALDMLADTVELHLPDQDKVQKVIEEFNEAEEDMFTLSGSEDDFVKFRIKVKDQIIYPKLSKTTRFSYYKLCCKRKSCLHDNFLPTVSPEMAAEFVKTTVEAADAIAAYKRSSSETDMAVWARTLEGCMGFGMDVGFLLDRLKKLEGLVSDFRTVENRRAYVKEEILKTEMKIQELGKIAYKLQDERKTLEVEVEKFDANLQEEANAPW